MKKYTLILSILLILSFIFQACDLKSVIESIEDEQSNEETIEYEICNNNYSSDVPSTLINCDDNCQEIDGECYYNDDINFLWDLFEENNIDSSFFKICDNFNFSGEDCFGQQTWFNGRLIQLDLDSTSLYNSGIDSLTNSLFSIIPPSINKLAGLTSLWLSGNNLENFPDGILDLSNLVSLSMKNCNLNSIPSSIDNLENLKYLWLDFNQLTDLPSSIENLKNLEWIYLNSNLFDTLSESICNLPNNCVINIKNNYLCSGYNFECINGWEPQNYIFIEEDDGVCDEFEGCMDTNACNFDLEAIVNGACIYPEEFVDSNENGEYDSGEEFIDNNNNGLYDSCDLIPN